MIGNTGKQTLLLSSSQFQQVLAMMKPKPESHWNTWGKSILVPVLITVLGATAAQKIADHYSQHQAILAQAAAAEKFIPYFDDSKSNQERYLAIQSLVQIGSIDAAADLLVSLKHDYSGTKAAFSSKISHTGTPTEAKTDEKQCESPSDGSANTADSKGCAAPTPDDEVYAAALAIYFRQLLPRICYLAGLPSDQSDSMDDVQNAVSDSSISIQNKNLEAIKLLMSIEEGRQAIEEIAFPQSLRVQSSFQRSWLAFWEHRAVKSPSEEEVIFRQQLGALRGIQSVIEQMRRALSISNMPDTILRTELLMYQEFNEPLHAYVSDSSSSSNANARVAALRAASALDPSFTRPSTLLKILYPILRDEKEPLIVRERTLKELLQGRNLTEATTRQLKDFIVQQSSATTLLSDRLRVDFAKYLASGYMHGDGDSDFEDTSLLPKDIFLDAFSRKIAQQDENGDQLLGDYWRMGGDVHAQLTHFDSWQLHRQVAFLLSLRLIALNITSADILELASIQSHNMKEASIRDAAFGILLDGPPDIRKNALSVALTDPSATVVQRALRSVRRLKACESLPFEEAVIRRMPSPADRYVTLRFWAQAGAACNQDAKNK